ncbi:hypothetical protein RB11603 [Rhodopirellula baltica SH 1]|uniref:Uncharacterized protein n=1 Tax=Rhodopirellula baltica (strain DSM 10527 / NCIMB 13988 / SH1) TaxID=243090 RepID=Q7UE39_RHOBA|nr:hypothetical protein RB11603 [Rhodopirellula baltica SH 1]
MLFTPSLVYHRGVGEEASRCVLCANATSSCLAKRESQ